MISVLSSTQRTCDLINVSDQVQQGMGFGAAALRSGNMRHILGFPLADLSEITMFRQT